MGLAGRIRLAPSILSADFSRLGEEIKLVEESGADLIHIDIMDGHFVPNITIGPDVVADIRKETSLPLDVHLMIQNPAEYISRFAASGADWITVHLEAGNHLHRLLQQLKENKVKAGVAINPATPISLLDEVLEDTDYIVIMSVNPGFGGQAFIPMSLSKVSALRQKIDENKAKVEIEVDGGVTKDNAPSLAIAGADILVAGSAIFSAEDPQTAIGDIRRSIMEKNII